MRSRHYTYIAFALLPFLAGCLPDKAEQELRKWRITLESGDKKPYGTWLAHESLKYYFPDATTEALSQGFRYSNMDNKMKYNYSGHSLLVLEGLYFYLSNREWEDLKQFVSNGNEVILFSSSLDSKMEQELNCYKELSGDESAGIYRENDDFDNEEMLTLTGSGKKYGYTGRSLKGYFTFKDDSDSSNKNSGTNSTANASDNLAKDEENNKDSKSDFAISKPDTLGYAHAKPDFLRYKIGEGHLTLHAAPLVLSNYFLLQDGNEQYLTAIWQTLPRNINRIYWQDYFERNTEVSSWSILWRYPATRYALLLAIGALLMYVLFEIKRKQRIIPIIPPLKNDSVSFVETVGRLYYNKGDHTNLSEKMVQQFLEWVRTHYFVNTNLINENFIAQLTIKSGQPEPVVRGLVDMIHEIKMGNIKPDDAYLYQLYNTIQQFYKNIRI